MKVQEPKQNTVKMVPIKHEMKNITIFLTDKGKFSFYGRYLPERQKENWHYYLDDKGTVYHIKKEHMIAVIEEAKE